MTFGASAIDAHQPTRTAPPARRLVLCIESEAADIALMADLLADFDWVEIAVATTIELGLEIARVRQPDLVIVDLDMPDRTGLEAARQLRAWQETQSTPVIALSGRELRETSRASRAGFYRYFEKPLKIDAFVSALEPLLGAETAAPAKPAGD